MWDRVCVDATTVPAHAGGEHTGRNPADHGKLGCEHHLLVDQRGLPLVAKISGAQVADARFRESSVDGVGSLSAPWGATPLSQIAHPP